jgi:hypothetical protein
MNKINPIIFGVLIIINTLIGLIIKDYQKFNFLMVDFMLIIHYILRFFVLQSNTKDAFKISHGFIISLLTIISVIFSIFLPNQFQNNILLILLIVIIGIQLLISLTGVMIFKKEIK